MINWEGFGVKEPWSSVDTITTSALLMVRAIFCARILVHRFVIAPCPERDR